MSEANDNILSKIEKLLALGASTSEHEAALAIGKAQELMQRHQISQEQLKGFKDRSARGPVVMINVPFHGKTRQGWEISLASGMARSFSSSHVYNSQHVFIGRENDLKIVEYLFVTIKTLLLKMAEEHTRDWVQKKTAEWGISPRKLSGPNHPKTYRTGWINGCVGVILYRLNEQYQIFAQSDEANAMVKVDLADVNAFKKKAFPTLDIVNSDTAILNYDGFKAGALQGSKIPLTKGIDTVQPITDKSRLLG